VPARLTQLTETSDGGTVARQFGVALFSAFMCATDTVSMGAVLFPQAAPALRSQGIRMCLLTTAVANVALACLSEVPHGVGALTDTVVPILGAFFASIDGLESPATALVAIPLLTSFTGLAMYAAGRIGLGEVVKACPYAVFGGFIAGTGAQLIELSLNMMLPGFTHVLDLQSWRNLLTAHGAVMCGPGLLAAVFTFVLPRFYPPVDSYLLPSIVVALTASFYGGLLYSGTSLEEARSAGWLFDQEIPNGVDCLQVWTYWSLDDVNWSIIFSSKFAFTFLQLFCVSFLTTVKNIYGTNEFTKTRSDIDKELCTAGITNAVCGMVGGCPSGMVMSFSVAAHALGARGKLFSWLLAALSAGLFVFGDYLVAVLPKMVPACVVLWIGLVLLIYYIWDPIGKVSFNNYAIIVVMVFVDLSFGCSLMITIGLFLTFLSTFRNMMDLPAIRSSYTLGTVRSDILRPSHHNNVLSLCGSRSMALQVEAGLLTFVNSFKILDFVELSDASLEFLIIDWSLVKGVCDSAVSTIKEMLRLAERRSFFIVFAAVGPPVEEALQRTGIRLDDSVGRLGPVAAAEATTQGLPGSSVVLVKDFDDGVRFVDAMVLAVEFVEECIILGRTKRADSISTPSPGAGRPRANSIRSSMLAPLQSAWEELSIAGFDANQPAFAAVVDMHWWLSCLHTSAYCVSDLRPLAAALEEHIFNENEVIYSLELPERLSHTVHIARTAVTAPPPLIWLLEGEVEHCWNGHNLADCSHLADLQQSCGIRANMRLEKASLERSPIWQCLGPLRTTAAFSGVMGHAGRLVATRAGTRVALLHRARYTQLLRESPEAADLLNVYLTKKQFVDAARFYQTMGLQVWKRVISSS